MSRNVFQNQFFHSTRNCWGRWSTKLHGFHQIQRITYYAAKKDFWIYLRTNARLLRVDVIDKLADAGISTFNIAVDAVDIKQGLPKALAPIRKQFDYLVRKQYGYGYSVFLNINICRNNLEERAAAHRDRP